MKIVALIPLVASPALAHLALYHPAMYGLKPDDYWSWRQTEPQDSLAFKDWWFHGYINEPPADGVFMDLPAGGTFIGEITCGKTMTSMRNPDETNPPPLPLMACDKAGDNGAMGAIHATDVFPGPAYGQSKSVKGVGLAIAYESDVSKIKPEDFVVISVNHTAPWVRETAFQIPKGLPACPAAGCHCMWGWIPDPMNVQQMYTIGYRCRVTGEVGTEYPAKPQVARKCPFDRSNCTVGAKQLHFWLQKEGNNNFQDRVDPPFYDDDYGFHDGAQTDIWTLDDGKTWNTNTSDLAPLPWQTLTSVDWSTSMNPTWTTTPDVRGATATASASVTSAASSSSAASAASSAASAASSAASASATSAGHSGETPSPRPMSSATPTLNQYLASHTESSATGSASLSPKPTRQCRPKKRRLE